MTEQQLRQATVDQFNRWLGWSQSNGKYKLIIDFYNKITPLPANHKLLYTEPWCAATVSAVAQMMNLINYIYPECSCNRMIALYKKHNKWEENDAYKPKLGDLCFYDWDDNGVGDCTGEVEHVGMVYEVFGDSFRVIEGNYSNEVKIRSMKVNGKYIRGFGLPDYAKASVGYKQPIYETKIKTIAGQVPYLHKGSSNEAVKVVKLLFNNLGFNSGDDSLFDERLEAVVTQYQKMYGLRQNGVVSRDVWLLLLQGKPKK